MEAIKNSNRCLFLAFILVLSPLSLSFTPTVLGEAKSYGVDPMEYQFIEGTNDAMYANLTVPDAPVSISTFTNGYAPTPRNSQRSLVRVTNGTLYATYVKVYSGYYQIYVKKSNDNGATWSGDTRISTYSGMESYQQSSPCIAVSLDDYLHVVWHGKATGFTSQDQIWYAKYTTSWSEPVRLSTAEGQDTTRHLVPSIAVDSNNYTHVVWYGEIINPKIWYVTYTTSWSEPLLLSTYEGMELVDQYGPSIAVDSNDYLHVIWFGYAYGFSESYEHSQIWYVKYTTSWSYPVRLSTYGGMGTNTQLTGSIAINLVDYIHVVWYGKTTSGYPDHPQIWYVNYTTSWSYPVRLSTYTNMEDWDQERPTIGLDSADHLHVLWQGKGEEYADYDKVWHTSYKSDWSNPVCIQSVGRNEHPILRCSTWPGYTPGPTWTANINLVLNITDDSTVDYFDWGSSWGDSAFWYTENPWVFEGKRRYNFLIDYQNATLGTVKQFGLRFTDGMGQIHTIWYDKDANTLTVTSPFDSISGWVNSFTQTETRVVTIFQIMFNTPIPDSYGVQLKLRAVANTDSGWLTPTGGIFNIYNLGGLSTLYKSGTADRMPGGDIFEIYAADTRTRNIIPTQDFDVRYSSLSPGVQIAGVQIVEAEDEQKLLEELVGWKIWMTSRTEKRTIYPTNRLPATAADDDLSYVSYPFGLLIKSDSTLDQSLMIEKEFFRKIDVTDEEIVTAEVWATVANDTKITGQILISDDGYVDDAIAGTWTPAPSDSKRIVDFKFYGNGNIRLMNGTSNIYPATYTGMTWANYTFVMNLTAQTYDFYVDDILNASAVKFREAATSVGHITFLDTLNPVFPAQPVEFLVDDVWVHTDFDEPFGGAAEGTMLFDKNQHWSMDFDFFVEDGSIHAQGASGTPRRVDDDYSNYGYLELGWDLMINKTMAHDFLVARVNITDGHISGKNDWIQFNVTWYQNGSYVKNDVLYGLFEGYSLFPGDSKDTCGFHWDIWFNRANASTVVGARINTEYYGMSDKSVWWAVWSSKWTAMRSEVSESTLFVDLEDAKGVVHSAQDVSFVRSWVKVLRDTRGQFAYKVLNIAGLDFPIARDTMSGIDTPPIRETLVPEVASGWFGSFIGGIFTAALRRLGNLLAGFGLGLFSLSIDFIDNVFAALGYPGLVATVFGWMDSLFASVPTLLGYGLTLIGQIYLLINTSAGNTLTQLASIITIWISMYSTVMDLLTGVLTPGINLWRDLGINNFIMIGAILYPMWLLAMWSDKGMQAVIDHLNGVLNIGSFFLNFVLNVAGFFVSLLTGLIGAIRG